MTEDQVWLEIEAHISSCNSCKSREPTQGWAFLNVRHATISYDGLWCAEVQQDIFNQADHKPGTPMLVLLARKYGITCR